MAFYLFETSLANLKHMEVSLYPLWVGDYALLQPWPGEKSRLTAIAGPFTLPVLILNAASFQMILIIFLNRCGYAFLDPWFYLLD